MIVLLVSFEEMEHAEKMANHLIDNRLAACIELFPVKSFYVWKGEKMSPNEISGVIKAPEENVGKIEESFKNLLSYDIPQIIKLEASANESYEKWAKESVT